MANVLGVLGDTLGIYQFIAGLFASKGANIATVRVAAGLNGNGLNAADGSIAAIRLYNENQQLVGSRNGGYIGSGGFADFAISQPSTQQAPYVQLGAANDAICIPYVTTTWVDGAKYGWVGDWGAVCGLEWYYGNVFVDNGKHKPRCTWIDNDHTNNIRTGLLFIHFPSFTDKKPHGTDKSNYCKYPALRAYAQNNGGTEILKRDEIEDTAQQFAERVKRNIDSRLVISSDANHNATALCESKTSRGPDLVSLSENVYCNMETRETLPLCAKDTTTECFSIEAKSKVKRDGNASQKDFTDILVWD